MSGTHGDLYSEIGRLVVAADSGRILDLATTSEELSQRYANLNVPPDAMARAIARSLGAVGVSMALLNHPRQREDREPIRLKPVFPQDPDLSFADPARHGGEPKAPSLFPSGVRLALLS